MPKQVFFPYPERKPKGFSPVTRAGSLVFVAGQVALDGTGALVGEGDCGSQSEQCFKNIEAAITAAGAKMTDIMKITAFLVNASDYAAYASAREQVFPEDPPASSSVIVAELIRPEYLVEVEAVAIVE